MGIRQRVFFIKAQQALGAAVLLAMAPLAGYLTYRHWTYWQRLPAVSWRPTRLNTPLSGEDIQGAPLRFVKADEHGWA